MSCPVAMRERRLRRTDAMPARRESAAMLHAPTPRSVYAPHLVPSSSSNLATRMSERPRSPSTVHTYGAVVVLWAGELHAEVHGRVPRAHHTHLLPSPQTRAAPFPPCARLWPRALDILQSWLCVAARRQAQHSVNVRVQKCYAEQPPLLLLPHPQRLLFARQHRRHLVLLLHLLPQLAEATQQVARVPRILGGLDR